MPGVTVTATHSATGVVTTVLSNDAGVYNLAGVQPGTYKLSATLPGFQTQTFNDVQLGNAGQLRLNFTLQVAAAAQAVEVTVEADLRRHGLPSLAGIIDLVRPNGRIVDFKTSGKTPNGDNVAHLSDTQTTCYSVLYREATGKKESAIELHHLVKTKNPKLVVTPLDPATEIQKTRLFRVIESYVHALQRADFVPSPGIQCSSCEFFNECRAWS